MEDQHHRNSPSHGSDKTEPVRSRWTPKPEQILILESIFNSGMVNPPKEETVRIRKLLEKFGSVGDANVFYWFQNRRSRSRRRQRQLQASLEQRNQIQPQVSSAIPYEHTSTSASAMAGFGLSFADHSTPTHIIGSSSMGGGGGQEGVDGLFSISAQMGFPEIIDQSSDVTSGLYAPDASSLSYHSGSITVFINGVATEVSRGPIDIKTAFGQDLILVHSSGVPVPTNEFGFLMQNLQHGESYFLVFNRGYATNTIAILTLVGKKHGLTLFHKCEANVRIKCGSGFKANISMKQKQLPSNNNGASFSCQKFQFPLCFFFSVQSFLPFPPSLCGSNTITPLCDYRS